MGCKRALNKAADPITRAVIDAVDRSGLLDVDIAEKAGVSQRLLHIWRSGRCSATCANASYVLEAVGARFTVTEAQ